MTLKAIADMYVQGFRQMTVGRTLWALVIVKLIVLFLVVKLFFFPNILKRDYATDEDRARAVRERLTGQAAPLTPAYSLPTLTNLIS